MTAALGSLVVSLGLDAAQYTQGLTKAEFQARKLGESLGTNIRGGALVATGALTAMTGAAVAVLAGFNAVLESAAKFQDMAEETGASAESLASLGVAAGTAGVTMESVAGATIKLTKSLVGVDDESKAAGAALAALGLNVAEFKKLDPVEQYKAAAVALGGYADGAGKTAVAVALWGKAGAEQLKVMKALHEQGGATKILTDQQIAQADEYLDKQAKLRTELTLYGAAVATNFIEPTNAVMGLVAEASREVLGLSSSVDKIAANTGIRTFAESAGRALASVADNIARTKREFELLIDVGAAYANIAGKLASFDLAGAETAGKGFRDKYGLDDNGFKKQAESGAKAAETFVQAYDRVLAASKRSSFANFDPRRLDLGKDGKPVDSRPQINYSGTTPKPRKSGGGAASTAAAEARSQLAFDLDEIQRASEAIISTYANQERIVAALHSAGLKDEASYYAEKKTLLDLTSAAGADSLLQQISRMKTETLLGKDQIDNLRKIRGAEADLAKFRANAATSAEVLSIQQVDALDKIAAKFDAARAAAKGFADAISNQNGRELAGLGKGNTQREKDTRSAGREDQFRAASDGLLGQLRSGDITQADYKAFLAIQENAHQQALASDAAYWAKKAELQTSWALGAREGLTNYFEGTQNAYDQMQKAGENAFKGLEDALVGFTQTGKFNFASFADSVAADILRISVRQQITGPLAQMLSGSLGGASGGGADIGSWFAGLFGRASGGSVQPWQMVRVNENGPEMLDYGGKQYLMNGARNSRVMPLSGGGGSSIVNHINVLPGATRETGYQAARATARELQRAGAR